MEGLASLLSVVVSVVALVFTYRATMRTEELQREKLSLETEQTKTATQISLIENQLKTYTALVDDLREEVLRHQKERDRLVVEIEGERKARHKLELEVAKTVTERNALEARVLDLERHLGILQEQLKEKSAIITELQAKLQHAQSKILILQGEQVEDDRHTD